MSIKNFLAATSIALLPLAAGAATFIVPVAGTGPGANSSQWSSELTLHNTSTDPVQVGLTFRDRLGVVNADAVTLGARATVSIADIVKTTFGRQSTTGAIEVTVPDAAAKKITIASRVINSAPTGEFGQDVDAVRVEDAAAAGDLTILATPSNANAYRFNFGLYAVEDTSVRWELVRANGAIVTAKEVNYAAGSQTQYNTGVSLLFGAEAHNNDSIHALVTAGRAIFYGSAVNNATGDPYYVRGLRAREDIRIDFLGLDLDENGTVDVFDADHDGVVDHPIDIYTSMFPAYFRIVSKSDSSEPVSYEILGTTPDVQFIDDNGTIIWAATGDLKGKTGALKVRARSGSESTVLTIPVNFR